MYIPEYIVDNKILLQENDLITPAVTSLENIGKVAVIDKTYKNVTAGGFVYIFRPFLFDGITSKIIMNFMSSSLFQSLMKSITKKSGQAFYNMNKERLKELYFPLPPIQEQYRILKKINSFIPLLDIYRTYEQKLSELEKTFPDKLKKSILQFAIEGKLVRQDPTDEPAIVLLERINKEKEQLVKEGKIKRNKNDNLLIQDDYKNYYKNIPSYWCKAPLRNICTKIIDGNHNPPVGENFKTEYLMISSQNIGDGILQNLNNVRYLTSEKFILENKRTNLQQNDILFTSVGSIGRSLVYNGNLNICFQRSVSIITTLICPDFLKCYLDAPETQHYIIQNSSGTAQKGFYLNQLSNLIISFPSILEQKRIVFKINQLNQLIN